MRRLIAATGANPWERGPEWREPRMRRLIVATGASPWKPGPRMDWSSSGATDPSAAVNRPSGAANPPGKPGG